MAAVSESLMASSDNRDTIESTRAALSKETLGGPRALVTRLFRQSSRELSLLVLLTEHFTFACRLLAIAVSLRGHSKLKQILLQKVERETLRDKHVFGLSVT